MKYAFSQIGPIVLGVAAMLAIAIAYVETQPEFQQVSYTAEFDAR